MHRRTLVVLVVTLSTLPLVRPLQAQPAYRVKDVNPGWNLTWPHDLTTLGGRLFFVADDGPHGPELWTSDGTGAGTARVPGTSGISRVFAGSSDVYFTKDATPVHELWRSDGTPGGTALVMTGFDYVNETATVGALTYFATGNGTPMNLWRTDGTAAGTFQLFGSDGQEPLYVGQLVASNGLLFFVAAGSSPNSLWRSDGTAAGTWPVTAVGAGAGLDSTLAAFGGRVYFAAGDADYGTELWSSDGTPQGTNRVADISPGSQGSFPKWLTVSGGRLHFTAFEPTTGRELWTTDGSGPGTQLVADVTPGAASTWFEEIVDAEGRLFFVIEDDLGLWTSDGTQAGTMELGTWLFPSEMTAIGSRIFFSASDALGSGELWTSDGTVPGTHLVKRISPKQGLSAMRSLTAFGNLLFLLADDGVHGPQLWKSDGTADGTTCVAVVRPGGASSSPRDFKEVSGTAFFLTGNPYAPGEISLWASDGTGMGTVPFVTGLEVNAELSATRKRLFWLEGYAHPPRVLMMSDGTAAGTGPVPVPPEVTHAAQPVCTDEKAFFFEGTNQRLWVADGTPAGTQWLGFSDSSGTPRAYSLAPMAGNVVFLVSPIGGGTELWRSDGTAAGTTRVKAISARSNLTCSSPPRRLGRVVLFLEDDGSTGCNVWRSDGTPEGTISLGVVGAGSYAQMSVVGSARGFLVFTDYEDLWRSDGTPEGTFLLRSFPAGALATPGGAGTHEGVYFAVQTNGLPDTTQQLWITDGTVAGTVLLHDFKAGSEDSRIDSLTTANGRLLASIGSATEYRPSLWTSDGTPAGTAMIQDYAGASPGGLPFRGVTLFAGTDPWAGKELWAIEGSTFTAPVRPTSLWVLTPCRVLDTRLASGFLGGPVLEAGAPRLFPVGGACGIPSTARSIAANITVTGATSDGLLRIHASDIGAPDATVVSFRAGRTRANNATIGLGADAEFTVRLEAPSGEAHVIVDVVGWYE